VEWLTRELEYRVPDQYLEIDWSRPPALPRSRFVIRDVRSF
jgi:fatty-acid peroxygenase